MKRTAMREVESEQVVNAVPFCCNITDFERNVSPKLYVIFDCQINAGVSNDKWFHCESPTYFPEGTFRRWSGKEKNCGRQWERWNGTTNAIFRWEQHSTCRIWQSVEISSHLIETSSPELWHNLDIRCKETFLVSGCIRLQTGISRGSNCFLSKNGTWNKDQEQVEFSNRCQTADFIRTSRNAGQETA